MSAYRDGCSYCEISWWEVLLAYDPWVGPGAPNDIFASIRKSAETHLFILEFLDIFMTVINVRHHYL